MRPACLQTATQTRLLDVIQQQQQQQQLQRTPRLMKHSNSDGMLLSRSRDCVATAAAKQHSSSAVIECPVCPLRRELTTTLPSTAMQDDDRVWLYLSSVYLHAQKCDSIIITVLIV